jgi:hypothetical protein
MTMRLRSVTAMLAVAIMALFAIAPSVAHAQTTCSDSCTIGGSVETPLGVVTISASAANVVTVTLAPSRPRTLAFGVPFAIPPGPPAFPGYARTVIPTAAGTITVDTYAFTGARSFALPGVAIIAIHPPSPCRVDVAGNTVVFTPIG